MRPKPLKAWDRDGRVMLCSSFGKSLAYGEPSEIFRRVWVPLESSLDDEFVYQSAKLAALESLRGGFTTACDAGTRARGCSRRIPRSRESASAAGRIGPSSPMPTRSRWAWRR